MVLTRAIQIITHYEHELFIDPDGDGALDYINSLPDNERALLDQYLSEKIRHFAPGSPSKIKETEGADIEATAPASETDELT